jgi:hypothetical protein
LEGWEEEVKEAYEVVKRIEAWMLVLVNLSFSCWSVVLF